MSKCYSESDIDDQGEYGSPCFLTISRNTLVLVDMITILLSKSSISSLEWTKEERRNPNKRNILNLFPQKKLLSFI